MSASAFCPHGRPYGGGCLDCLRPGEVVPRELLSPPETQALAKSCARCGRVYPWGANHVCPPRVELVRG